MAREDSREIGQREVFTGMEMAAAGDNDKKASSSSSSSRKDGSARRGVRQDATGARQGAHRLRVLLLPPPSLLLLHRRSRPCADLLTAALTPTSIVVASGEEGGEDGMDQ